jgi:tetratricopeptide (TPR) repeat protein
MRALRGSSRGFPWFALLAAVFWNGMVGLMLSTGMRPARGVSPLVVYLAAGAFVLVGLALVWWLLKSLARHRRFRGVMLYLDQHPAVAGGAVAGSLPVPIAFDPAHRYRVTLRATEHAASLSGGKIHTTMRTLFEEEGSVRAEPAGGGTRLRFSCALPAEAPASQGYGASLTWTTNTVDRVYLQWHLNFTAEVPGIDLDEGFEVNVTRSGVPLAAKAPVTEASAAGTPLPAGHNPAFQYERAGERVRIAQPAWKKPGNIGSAWNVLLGVGTGLLFAGVGVFLLGIREWLIGGAFFGVGALCVVGVVAYLAHALAVEVNPDGLRIVRSIGGVVFKDVTIHRAHVAAIEAAAESDAQPHGSALARSVRVRARDGSVHTIAEMLPRQQDAVALRNLVAARLALGAEARVGSAAVAQPTIPGPERKKSASFKWAGGLVVVAVVAYQAWPFARTMLFSERAQPQPKLAPAGPEATNVGAGYPAQYVRVTGKGFRAEAHGADLHIRIGEVRLEPTGKIPAPRYQSLGISVSRRAGNRYQDAGSASNPEARGDLARPEVLRDQVFVVRGAAAHCAQGGCEAQLVLVVQSGANSAYAESTGMAALPVSATREIAAPAEAPPKYWDTHLNRASAAVQQGRTEEGMRLFGETLAFVQKNFGADHPIEAYVLVRKAAMHQRVNDAAGREQALLRALAILERHPAPEAKRAIGAGGDWMDKEMVARELGDLYWERRRYADALAHYRRAYDSVPELDTTDYSRNLKLAFDSAGIMATACVLGQWDLADRAMAELKRRYAQVRPESQRKLKYWIDTGEPRLQARRC